MTLAAQTSSSSRPSALSAIVLAGLGGGAVDFIFRGLRQIAARVAAVSIQRVADRHGGGGPR
jgi:hypothetical protein